jgi:hypothetical protein
MRKINRLSRDYFIALATCAAHPRQTYYTACVCLSWQKPTTMSFALNDCEIYVCDITNEGFPATRGRDRKRMRNTQVMRNRRLTSAGEKRESLRKLFPSAAEMRILKKIPAPRRGLSRIPQQPADLCLSLIAFSAKRVDFNHTTLSLAAT